MRLTRSADMKIMRWHITQPQTIFWLAALLAGGLFWVPTYPPMIDVPQHAGQVSLLLDMLRGNNHRTEEFSLNLLTPYWLGYGLWTLLACSMPLLTALKLLLTVTYWLFIIAAVALRMESKADARLDWLLLPAFFGFAFKWGFLTFIMAAPLTLLLLIQSLRHTTRATPSRTSWLLAGGILLFCSHALAFLYWLGCSYLIILFRWKTLSTEKHKLLPFMALAVLPPIYYLLFQDNTLNQQIISSQTIAWRYDSARYLELLIYPYGDFGSPPYEIYIFLAALISPFLLRLKTQLRTPLAAPILVILLIWFSAPDYAMKTNFLYERFALLAIPAFIILFRDDETVSLANRTPSFSSIITTWLIPLLSLSIMTLHAWQFTRFEHETLSFRRVMASIPENGRLLSLIQYRPSEATHTKGLYINFGSWYQAEKGGITDFNFAWFPPQPVRYRKEALPPISPRFPWNESKFDWRDFNANRYDYFLVHKTPEQPDLLTPYQCTKLLAQDGYWQALARTPCHLSNKTSF